MYLLAVTFSSEHALLLTDRADPQIVPPLRELSDSISPEIWLRAWSRVAAR